LSRRSTDLKLFAFVAVTFGLKLETFLFALEPVGCHLKRTIPTIQTICFFTQEPTLRFTETAIVRGGEREGLHYWRKGWKSKNMLIFVYLAISFCLGSSFPAQDL
jgi:hypothetical protein